MQVAGNCACVFHLHEQQACVPAAHGNGAQVHMLACCSCRGGGYTLTQVLGHHFGWPNFEQLIAW